MEKRQRHVDVDKLSQEEVDALILQIGDKVRYICDETADRVNAILGVYGMSAKIAIAFDTLPPKMEKITDGSLD